MPITLPPELTGQTFGLYKLLPPRIEGGMAVVYRASQPIGRTTRDVAVKVIDAGPSQDPDAIRQFEREAELLAKVDHPHIVKLYADGQQEPYRYLVMALLNGGSLADLLFRNGKLPSETVRLVLDQIGSALDALHRIRYVHCDLKPANVLLNQTGDLFLTDFGIAEPINNPINGGSPRGTPEYAAPEQWRGEAVNAQTDIYALGVMLFELLTGQPPFVSSASDQASRIRELRTLHLSSPSASVLDRQASLSPGVKTVIERALSKSPADRYPTAASLRDAYEAAIGVRPGEARLSPVIVVSAPLTVNQPPRSMPLTGNINPPLAGQPAQRKPAPAVVSSAPPANRRPLISVNSIPFFGFKSLLRPFGIVFGAIALLLVGGLIATQIIAPVLAGDVPPYIDPSPQPAKPFYVTITPAPYLSAPSLPTSVADPYPTVTSALKNAVTIRAKTVITTVNAGTLVMAGSYPVQSNVSRLAYAAYSNGALDILAVATADGQARRLRITTTDSVQIGLDVIVKVIPSINVLTGFSAPNDSDPILIAAAPNDPNNQANLWRLNTLPQVARTVQVDHPVVAVAGDAQGKLFAVGDSSGQLAVWSTDPVLAGLPNASPLFSIECGNDPIRAMAFNADSTELVAVDQSGVLCGWNINDPLKLKSNLFKPVGEIDHLAFSPNGRFLALAAADGTIQLLKASDGSQLGALPNRGGALTDFAFSPYGGLLAVTSTVDALTLWNLDTFRALTVQMPGQSASSVAWSPDGQQIATGGPDGVIRIWRAP